MPNPIPVIVLGERYNTIREAWRAASPEGLPEITVRRRLAMGWTPDQAFIEPAVEPAKRRGHKLERLNG